MTAEAIEGDVLAVTVVEPEQLERARRPEDTIELASRMATVLKDIVERQHLYAVIQGKKFPQVEAWMTIGRMDNVVAREVDGGVIRHDDGSYEATVELIRLADGMVVGRASALCGTSGDRPWDSRPEPARRSMAVTRATSRAFRLVYSWIMALAGYEPTPADEMSHEEPVAPMRPELEKRAEGLIGEVQRGSNPVDLELRYDPDGIPFYGFKLAAGRKGFQCVADGPLAEALSVAGLRPKTDDAAGETVTVFGSVESVPWQKDGKDMPPYTRVHLERVQTAEWTLPAEDVA